ncbi:tRNA preQ1(34) S-adenosylmethionine ribosyltransferase-isomerase QueA [Aerosakkonema funiforme]|uniref:S-adenosylmethionine:tRNA ribosyltransferase-isomerase n=1 Tax=Aerosakkonema funiforme FACHB-1375 TaxID=2949571 RepID=A0A926VF16_9CYAN|nr:tRNA preQ1(34) S-adenosylmethionine ribosyltransferase-isomerase QueA [Aerosakkonema funiforme]MBD2181304.1 tRNA preQ1(34) S-adenosylmethionine ribosyltransferase-isomerase QueA [Aerosakkonema funiforme FACHB-1375]
MPNKDEDLLLAAYDYQLPEERIAQNPAIPRDSSRLLVVDSPSHHSHHIFRDLPNLLKSGDLLVLNNTRTIPARLYGRKISGTAVEVLLLEELENNSWLALVKPGKRLPPGTKILFEAQLLPPEEEDFQSKIQNPKSKIQNQLTATVVARDEGTGGRILQFELPPEVSLIKVLGQFGHVPLPPYIKNTQSHPEQYQTVYGERPGAIAAPTAGLHFTTELLKQLQEKGIEQVYVTLHVGVGTFRPVEAEDITAHKMHSEWVEVSPETVAKIRATQARGGRVIAVGTTVVRSLEGAAVSGELQPFCGKTELFIYPGYKWRVVEGLITNFHLPRSSLLMLVSAKIGRDRLLSLYREAIAREYRFYSFGDAMLILPEAKLPN